MTSFREEALTDSEKTKLSEYYKRDAGQLTDKRGKVLGLSPNMKAEMSQLIAKRDSPIEVSQTVKTYARVWAKERLYGTRRSFTSKYTEKGNEVEGEAIDLLREYLNRPFLKPYEGEEREDDFKKGTCDIEEPDMIIDIKSPWTCFTFPLFHDEIHNSDHEWQLEGYADLWKKKKTMIAYILIDAPDHLIEREAWSMVKDLELPGMTEDIMLKARERLTYSHLPIGLRVRLYRFEPLPQKLANIHTQVDRVRRYIDTITSPVLKGVMETA